MALLNKSELNHELERLERNLRAKPHYQYLAEVDAQILFLKESVRELFNLKKITTVEMWDFQDRITKCEVGYIAAAYSDCVCKGR